MSFLTACLQIILWSALFVTDEGLYKQGHSRIENTPAENALYRITSDGGLQRCQNVPGTCLSFTLDDMRRLASGNVFDDELCPMVNVHTVNW